MKEKEREKGRESVQTSRVSTKMNETTEITITITTITFKRRGPQLKKLQVPNSKREIESGKRGRNTCICICN